MQTKAKEALRIGFNRAAAIRRRGERPWLLFCGHHNMGPFYAALFSRKDVWPCLLEPPPKKYLTKALKAGAYIIFPDTLGVDLAVEPKLPFKIHRIITALDAYHARHRAIFQMFREGRI